MNKKKLSVVMAGAMLATTVAPVMAATTTDASANELGLLIGKVREILESKKYSNDGETGRNQLSKGNVSGQSVYYLKINGKEATDVTEKTETGGMELQDALQKALGNLKPGAKVEIWSRGYVTECSGDNEQIFAKELKTTYDATDMTDDGNIVTALNTVATANPQILAESTGTASVNVVNNKSITINLKAGSGVPGNQIVIEPGDKILDFAQYINDLGVATKIEPGSPATSSGFNGFPKASLDTLKSNPSNYQDVEDSLYETINITGTAPNTFKTSDLFNGVMLTTEGHDLLTKIEEVAPIVKAAKTVEGTADTTTSNTVGTQTESTQSPTGGKTNSESSTPTGDKTDSESSTPTGENKAGVVEKEKKETKLTMRKAAAAVTKGTVAYTTLNGISIEKEGYNLPQSSDGTYGFNIALTDANSNVTNYVIKGENKKDTTTLLNWLITQNPKVDILAGKDRYETAVKVAEEYVMNQPFSGTGKANVVMVNGNSLVDGLSASPLAAKLGAPMLLSKTDEVPKATLDYLKKLSEDTTISNLKNITINLVGGTGVLSKNVENQLKSLGYSVKRYGGANREATSMKVADVIGNKNNAFVVGANGEADAMSIASVASSKNIKESGSAIAPIIVSGFNGLSESTLEELENSSVTVLGGSAVVSDKEFDAIKEAVGTNGSVERLAGENRQQTNAKVINKYYANAFGKNSDVLVAKDGQKNKMELVDALTVSNLAALNNSPIVLATDKLSKSQLNAIELNAQQANKLFQVGHGVSLNVVKTIATNLGLN